MDKGTERWRRRTWRAYLVGGGLLIVLAVASLPLFLPDVLTKYQARRWPQGRARIVGARLDTGYGPARLLKGRAVELTFMYVTPTGPFDAKQEVSADYARDVGVTSASRVYSPLVSATAAPCWYDPALPSRAVLEREFVRKDLVALTPLVIAALGAGLLVNGRRVTAAAAADPVAALRHRNGEGWEVKALPGGGARCEPKAAARTSLVAIGSRWAPHPVVAIELYDLPLRTGGPARVRVETRPGGEEEGPGVTVDLQAGTPPRGLLKAGRTVWTQRVAGRPDEAAGEANETIAVTLPDSSQLPDGADDWWLRVVVEAGAVVHPPKFLLLPVETKGD